MRSLTGRSGALLGLTYSARAQPLDGADSTRGPFCASRESSPHLEVKRSMPFEIEPDRNRSPRDSMLANWTIHVGFLMLLGLLVSYAEGPRAGVSFTVAVAALTAILVLLVRAISRRWTRSHRS